MTLDEQIKIFEDNAEYVRRDGDLMECLCFQQLAFWLTDYKRLLENGRRGHEEIRAKKGMWMHRNDDNSDWLECSGCGHGEEGEVKIWEGTPFCPMCGREMLWEREEDR